MPRYCAACNCAPRQCAPPSHRVQKGRAMRTPARGRNANQRSEQTSALNCAPRGDSSTFDFEAWMFACIYIPDFPVEAIVRVEPWLREQAVAVLEGKPPLVRVV